jgi:nucleoid-associated protein EbfC
VIAAINEGIRKAEELQQSKLGAPGGAEGFDPMSMLDSLGMGGLGGLGGGGGGQLPGGAPNRAARRSQKKK